MATTPDDKPYQSKKEKVVAEVRKASSQYFTRTAVSIAACLAVGIERPGEALSLALLLFVIGGKR